MRKPLLAVLSLLFFLGFGSRLLAQEHQHEEFPQGTLLALEGVDAISKQSCFLFIMDVGFEGPEKTSSQFYAKILTGYTHNDEHADIITVKIHPARPGILIGQGSNGKDEVAIFLNANNNANSEEIDLRQATSFNSKWWHQNHFHNNRCTDLKEHAH